MHTVHLNGKDYKIDPKGEPMMQQLKAQGVEIIAACGGAGICQTCAVAVHKGKLSKKTETEEMMALPDEQRLSCQCLPESDCD